MKRVLALIFSLCMLVCLLPVGAEATQTHSTFTLLSNNIMQSFIEENGFNKDDPFGIKPTVRYNDLMRYYTQQHPDILCLQECDEGWHDVLDTAEGLASLNYAHITEGFVDEPLRMIRNPIYYDTTKFEVLDAGYTHFDGFAHGMTEHSWGAALANAYCYVWGVLKAKSDGSTFAVISCHLKSGTEYSDVRLQQAIQVSDAMKALEEKYNVPVIAAGDYNGNLVSKVHQAMTQKFLSARKSAAETANVDYKTTSYGNAPTKVIDGASIVDHVFHSAKGIISDKFEHKIESPAYCYSDHTPVLFTFRIDKTMIPTITEPVRPGEQQTGALEQASFPWEYVIFGGGAVLLVAAVVAALVVTKKRKA